MKSAERKTGTILDEIVANKRVELAKRMADRSLKQVRQRAEPCANEFLQALSGTGIKLIAEIKPKSPSAGELAPKLELQPLLAAYGKYASAISVLTDERYFGGSLDLLKDVSSKTALPTLCKEFIIDPYQIYEARESGAKAVLLIVKIVSGEELDRLQAVSRQLGMTAVVEVQTEEELKTALSASCDVILINNRDLTTFDVDLATTTRLAPLVPKTINVIAASGIESRADVEALLPCTNKFLIGSSFMRAPDLEQKMRELCAK